MKYKIKIKSKNQIFTINGRPVRSPLESTLDESSLKVLKATINHYGLKQTDYEIIPLIDNQIDYSKILTKNEVKGPIFKPEIQPTIQPITKEKIKTLSISFQDKQKNLCLDSNKETEQNINKDINADTEVRIEELTHKSTSILSRFLNGEF